MAEATSELRALQRGALSLLSPHFCGQQTFTAGNLRQIERVFPDTGKDIFLAVVEAAEGAGLADAEPVFVDALGAASGHIIVLRQNISASHRPGVIAHELAHVLLGHTHELAAESHRRALYFVCRTAAQAGFGPTLRRLLGGGVAAGGPGAGAFAQETGYSRWLEVGLQVTASCLSELWRMRPRAPIQDPRATSFLGLRRYHEL